MSNIRSHSSVDTADIKRAYTFWRSPQQHMHTSLHSSHNRHSVCIYTFELRSFGILGSAKSGDGWRCPSSNVPPSLVKTVAVVHLRLLARLSPGCLGPHANMGNLLPSWVVACSVCWIGGASSFGNRVSPFVNSHAEALRRSAPLPWRRNGEAGMAVPLGCVSRGSTDTTWPTLASSVKPSTVTAKRAV